MNYYSLVERKLIWPDRAEGFCKKRLSSQAENAKCLVFLGSLPVKGKVYKCPYGLCASAIDDFVLCGFECDGISDEKELAQKRKNGTFIDAPKFGQQDFLDIVNGVRLKRKFDIYSYFVHDIAHEIGVLKTHIEESKQCPNLPPDIEKAIELYEGLLNVYLDYKAKRLESPRFFDFWFVDAESRPYLIDIMEKKTGQYQSLIESMKNKLKGIASFADERVEDVRDYTIDPQTRRIFQSLLMMHSLFSYRIQYTDESLNLALNIRRRKTRDHKIKLFACLYKLVMFLKPEAKRQGLSGISLKGLDDVEIFAAESIYLALYILLENAVKYAVADSEVCVKVCNKDNDEYAVVIENVSDYISPRAMARIEEPGFSGENSLNKDSHGFGLAIVRNILKGSGIEVQYLFNEDKRVFSSNLRFRKISNE